MRHMPRIHHHQRLQETVVLGYLHSIWFGNGRLHNHAPGARPSTLVDHLQHGWRQAWLHPKSLGSLKFWVQKKGTLWFFMGDFWVTKNKKCKSSWNNQEVTTSCSSHAMRPGPDHTWLSHFFGAWIYLIWDLSINLYLYIPIQYI